MRLRGRSLCAVCSVLIGTNFVIVRLRVGTHSRRQIFTLRSLFLESELIYIYNYHQQCVNAMTYVCYVKFTHMHNKYVISPLYVYSV